MYRLPFPLSATPPCSFRKLQLGDDSVATQSSAAVRCYKPCTTFLSTCHTTSVRIFSSDAIPHRFRRVHVGGRSGDLPTQTQTDVQTGVVDHAHDNTFSTRLWAQVVTVLRKRIVVMVHEPLSLMKKPKQLWLIARLSFKMITNAVLTSFHFFLSFIKSIKGAAPNVMRRNVRILMLRNVRIVPDTCRASPSPSGKQTLPGSVQTLPQNATAHLRDHEFKHTVLIRIAAKLPHSATAVGVIFQQINRTALTESHTPIIH